MNARTVWSLLTVMGLAGCTGPTLDEVALPAPEFHLERFFDGPLAATGVVRDRGGAILRGYDMTLRGSWDNGTGILTEEVHFSDGETSRRQWHICRAGDNTWTATADDVVGEALFRGRGNTLRLDYVLRVPWRNRTLDLTVEDWLYLQPDGTVINQSVLKKWGVRVGDILTVIRRDGS